jgi:putative phosphoribosyl transferase
MFADRTEAGRRLAQALLGYAGQDIVVYALPRGGVPVAAEIALALDAPMDLVFVRKLGAPGQPELAMGAIVEGDPPVQVLNPDVVQAFRVGPEEIERVAQAELDEIKRRRDVYGRGHRPVPPRGRTAIVVDDGLATGATARAALQALRRQGAARIVLAVPVAPRQVVEAMSGEADEVVCLDRPDWFPGVGAFYSDFDQVPDEAVIAELRRVDRGKTAGEAP